MPKKGARLDELPFLNWQVQSKRTVVDPDLASLGTQSYNNKKKGTKKWKNVLKLGPQKNIKINFRVNNILTIIILGIKTKLLSS